MTNLFIDNEWADPDGAFLISMGIVAEDGREFYAEVAQLLEIPTPFCQEIVYPLLQRGETALSDFHFCHSLRTFLATFPRPKVISDCFHDLVLMDYVLNGLDMPLGQRSKLPRRPVVLGKAEVGGALGETVEAIWTMHPELGARRHHALVDARVLKWAWNDLNAR